MSVRTPEQEAELGKRRELGSVWRARDDGYGQARSDCTCGSCTALARWLGIGGYVVPVPGSIPLEPCARCGGAVEKNGRLVKFARLPGEHVACHECWSFFSDRTWSEPFVPLGPALFELDLSAELAEAGAALEAVFPE